MKLNSDKDIIEDPENIEVLTEKVLSILRKYEDESTDQPRIYFSGEVDSNQTKFEKQSNKLKIGVIGKSKIAARALLRLLRMHVDHNPLFDFDIKMMIEEEMEINYKNLIKMLGDQENDYGSDYDLSQPLTVEYVDGSLLTRNISDVNIWTLTRADKELDIRI